MNSCVGYAWRYLEAKGEQNIKPLIDDTKYSFFVESEEDEETLVCFMKRVQQHKELIPPLMNILDERQIQVKRVQNLRSKPDSSGLTQFSRQQIRSSDTVISANDFFSDLV